LVITLMRAGLPQASARSHAPRRAAQRIGLADELAVAAERLDNSVVACLGSALGEDGVTVEELHRVLLEAPDAVVDDCDDRDTVTGERVELHAGEPERTVPQQQHDLALGMGELKPARTPKRHSARDTSSTMNLTGEQDITRPRSRAPERQLTPGRSGEFR
jgi:hypothetical protein